MDQCPVCLAELTGSGVRCPSCGAVLPNMQPATQATMRQPPPREVSKTPKSSRSISTSTHSEGNFISGTILNERYRITGLLGRGGMGEVYKAEDLKLSQTVALKFLPEHFAEDKAARERFFGEVRTARQVSHPNVCRVFDIGEVEGTHFLSMEFIDGDDLSSLLRRIGRLPPDKALETARQLCAGLHAVHQAGILHRDFKPANVMIDGRGKARLTDFGIAGLESELKEGAIAGTPAYMSPEQITGKELSTKSDIYSLGLVLYEIFTGKQVFEGSTLNELLRKHKTATPTTPSEVVKDIDPIVEQVILRCLEKDQRERPASALQVAMMLPGGNPLEAAIAAGETPSPEMVAAAPKKGALKPAVAVACLLAVVALFAFIVFFSGKVKLHEWIPLDKPPEVLAERANQIKNNLGYADAPRDTVYSFGNDRSYVDYAQRADASPGRFERIRTGQPVTLYFWYRTSPRYLVPNGRHEVGFLDPPNDVSGMTRLALDVRGRLIYFEAVPPQVAEQTTQNIQADWSKPFAEAGLDIRNYTETKSQWAPPSFADERKAWEGKHVDHPEIPVRIEAAAFQGRAVYFEVVFPWDRPTRQTGSTTSNNLIITLMATVIIGVLLAGLILARYNLKAGRGDIRGASKLGVFIFSVFTLAQLLDANHVPELFGEIWIFSRIAGTSFLLTIFPWIFYIALEPFIRRRWPELIISWSRLMAGDFRDPLVGRDILVGGLLGLFNTAAIYLGVLLPQWSGIARPPYLSGNITEPLSGVGGLLTHFLFIFGEHINYAIALTFLLLLLLTILRKKWLAIPALGLIFSIPYLEFASGDTWIVFLSPLLIATAMTVATARFGVLALYSCFLFRALSGGNPITSDFSSWYAGSTLFVFVVLMGLALYGFYTSLAGQRLFKTKVLED